MAKDICTQTDYPPIFGLLIITDGQKEIAQPAMVWKDR